MSSLSLHDVIVHKNVPYEQAKHIAESIIKNPNKTYMRETKTSYRFRNIPKTKFSSFFSKPLNNDVTLIFGHLKE